MTVEVPVWLFFLMIFGLYILWFMVRDINKKISDQKRRELQNVQSVNESFRDIANDIVHITRIVDKLDAFNHDKTKH